MSDRGEDADRLERLHEATRDLMGAKRPVEVAEVATRTAEEVLGLDVNTVFFPDDEAGELVPVAATDRVREVIGEDVPHLHRGESMGWRVYERGEPAVYDDVREAELRQNPDTPMRSELILPLGDHGLFIAGTAEPAEFDDGTVSVARVFADNVEAALERAEREAALRERERELERQNERLEQFASVVSHDLRTPINVATGRLELAREECDSPHLHDVERALDRMEGLVDDLLTLARQGRTVGETRQVDLPGLVHGAGESLGIDPAVDPALGTVEADESRLRELVDNLLRNAVEHGGDDVSVRVEPLPEDRGFAVADDGPGIPPEDREQVFELGYTTATEGTGFGLAIVREVAEAHGWTVRVGESEAGGARFEVVTDPAGDDDDRDVVPTTR